MKGIILTLLIGIALVAVAQSLNAYIKQGNQHYMQSQFDLAEAQYRLALQEDPSSKEAKFNLANTLHQQKKYDQANQLLDQLQSSVKDSTTKSMSAYNQGVAFSKQKNLEESIEKYKQALRMVPGDQQARENLQKALRELKQKQGGGGQQKQNSNMNQDEADQKLKLLQQKEKQIQQRVRKSSQGGGSQSKDW